MASVLKVNGCDIPVEKDSWSIKSRDIGSRRPNFDGYTMLDRRNRVLSWEGKTPKLPQLEAIAYESAILGLGESWSYESDLASAGGLLPSSGYANRLDTTAGDGLPFAENSKYGSYMLAPALISASNLLTSDQSTVEDAPTGFSTDATTLTKTTTHYIQGSYGMLMFGSPGQSFWLSSAASATPSETYTASMYITTNVGTADVRLRVYETAGGSNEASTYHTITAGEWTRIAATVTVSGSATGVSLQLYNDDATSKSVYVDKLMIEGDTAGLWVEGGASAPTSPSDLVYPFTPGITDSISVCVWLYGYDSSPASLGIIFSVQDGNVHTFQLRQASYPYLDVSVYPVVYRATPLTLLSTPAWHHIGAILTREGDGSSNLKTVVDGSVYLDQDLPAGAGPAFSQSPISLNIDCVGNPFQGYIDDLVVVPYAMTVEQVQCIYSLGRQMSPLPEVYLGGTGMEFEDNSVLGLGLSETSEFGHYSDGDGTGLKPHRSVQFRLDSRGRA